MLCENETDLLIHWFKDIGSQKAMYKEPLLDSDTLKFFKQICEAFEQTTHVLILSIEIAEDYIRAKNAKKQKIYDPILAAVTITFMGHKCEGAQESLKLKHVSDLLFYYTKKYYDTSQVTDMEGDILVTLNGKLPITTTLDDMDVVIEKYIGENRLRASVRPLCLKLLELVYVERNKWFGNLKTIYAKNKASFRVFQDLISSKVYVPVSILIAALRVTHYRRILNIDNVLTDLAKTTRIHPDHLDMLANKIIEILDLID